MKIKAVVILSMLLITAQCETGNECREENKRPVNDHTRSYEEVCIGGHVYYEHATQSGYLASKLDDYGRPVKCY